MLPLPPGGFPLRLFHFNWMALHTDGRALQSLCSLQTPLPRLPFSKRAEEASVDPLQVPVSLPRQEKSLLPLKSQGCPRPRAAPCPQLAPELPPPGHSIISRLQGSPTPKSGSRFSSAAESLGAPGVKLAPRAECSVWQSRREGGAEKKRIKWECYLYSCQLPSRNIG